MNIQSHNSAAWDKEAEGGCQWSLPVDGETIQRARLGDWSVVLTPTREVPREWFPAELNGTDILCLASGGGQQAPILAAAGANVTSFDNSAGQLERDRFVAERENLDIRIEQGDAADLSRFSDESFDLIFHPVSNLFFPELQPVWNEAFRVLRPGGSMLAGFMNPLLFMFDNNGLASDPLKIKYALPYSDTGSLSPEAYNRKVAGLEPLEYSHTLEEQIGGQIAVGFMIAGFYEDHWSNDATALNKFTPTSMATRAVKP